MIKDFPIFIEVIGVSEASKRDLRNAEVCLHTNHQRAVVDVMREECDVNLTVGFHDHLRDPYSTSPLANSTARDPENFCSCPLLQNGKQIHHMDPENLR